MVLTIEMLREALEYDPATGVFRWKFSKRSKTGRPDIVAGNVAGNMEPHGYLTIRLLRRKFYAHRLAWMYVTGRMPKEQIDHRNGARSDNRFSNLREATRHQNMYNRPARGCSFDKSRNKWQVKISVDDKTKHFGRFDTEEEARRAYINACAVTYGREWIDRKLAPA